MRKREGRKPNSLPEVLGLITPSKMTRPMPLMEQTRSLNNSIQLNSSHSPWLVTPSPYSRSNHRITLHRARHAVSLLLDSTPVPSGDSSTKGLIVVPRNPEDGKRTSIVVQMPVLTGIMQSGKNAGMRPVSCSKQEGKRMQVKSRSSLFCRWMRYCQQQGSVQ